MARAKNTLLKGVSGKIGDIVTFERNGTQVVREHVIPKDPKTPAQLAQRMKLEVVNKGLSPLKNIIKRGHIGDSKAYRSSIGIAMKDCILGEYPKLSLDYSMIQLAQGKLQLPENISISSDEKTNTIYISWDRELAFRDKPGKHDDNINVVYFNERHSMAKTLLNAPSRIKGELSFTLPKEWEIADTHFWIYLTSYDFLHNSDSLYLKI